jgi:hypothetical protein
MEPEVKIHTCHICGYEWRHGMNGDHDCTVLLKTRISELEKSEANSRWIKHNVFINKKGDVWEVDKLIEATQHFEVKRFDVNKIDLDDALEWTNNNVRDMIKHYQRIVGADIGIPIILRSDGLVMDGWHRIIRAIAECHPLNYVQFEVDPPPDYNMDEFK